MYMEELKSELGPLGFKTGPFLGCDGEALAAAPTQSPVTPGPHCHQSPRE